MVPAWLGTGVAPAWNLVAGAEPAFGVCALGGTVVGGSGAALALWAEHVMGRSWRIGVERGERTTFVRHGPFRWVRNPFFAGMALVALGAFLAAPTIVGATALFFLWASLSAQVRLVEEPHLSETLGDEYRSYAAATGRFIPLIGRVRSIR